MTQDDINAAMAGLDEPHPIPPTDMMGNPFPFPLYDYTRDLNACQRVLRGVGRKQQIDAILALPGGAVSGLNVALATPAQWCEAILRATGKWTEGEA
jgi:hypothetical protein